SMDGVVFVDEDLSVSTDVAERILPSVEEASAWLERAGRALPLVVVALVVLLLFLLAARRIRRAELAIGPLRRNKLLRGLARQSLAVATTVLGLVLALRILGLGYLVGGLLGGAGVLGLAVGFAFKDILENYLASILLSLRRPFGAMDLVDVDGTTGTVLRMTSSQTVLMTADGNHVRIPNAAVFKGTVTNYTENPLRRFDFAIGIGANEDLGRAMRIGRETLEEMAGIADDPKPVARVEELGDSAVVVRYLAWVHQADVSFQKARSEAVRLVKAALDEHAVEMPVPIYEVDLRRGGARDAAAASPRPASAPPPDADTDPRDADVRPETDAVARRIEDEVRTDTEENLLRT
ncbi:MAG: mechanosensitive ion channel family protein, partial [Planctomycetota bacterium JB042]